MINTIDLKQKSYKTLIIVGNGLDIAMSHKTSYSDFVGSKNFKELTNSNNHLASFLCGKKNIQNWIDLEMELYNYSITLTEYNKSLPIENVKENNSTFKKEFDDVVFALRDFLANEQNVGKNNSGLEKLISDWVEESDMSDAKLPVISFNYTLCSMFPFKDDKFSYISAHGNIFMGFSDCVVGIDDSLEIDSKHSFLYKSVNKHIERDDISDIIKNAERYIIFGASLGKTDDWYYKQIFNHNFKDKLYEIYFYKEESLHDINGRIVELTRGCPEFWSKNKIFMFDSSHIDDALFEERTRNYNFLLTKRNPNNSHLFLMSENGEPELIH